MSGNNYSVKRFGEEQEPVIIIDDFVADPEAKIKALDGAAFDMPRTHYPGIRHPVSGSYLAERAALLEQIMRDEFGITSGARLIECNASIVTTPTEQLTPFQSYPHFDGTEPGRLAVLHYLCGPELGGTAFYHHKATGYETITPERQASYRAARQAEFETRPGQYFFGSRDGFALIGEVDAQPNRCIIYRSRTLHSGVIPNDYAFLADPRQGRLTLNSFFLAK